MTPDIAGEPMSNDEELMERVARSDRQAFLTLYDRYSARVYGLALYMLRDEMSAEEIAQDAFLKLWNRAETFRADRGTLLTWLLTVTRHLALDRIRLESRAPRIRDLSEAEDWQRIPDPVTETTESRWRAMRMAVGDLPLEQRQVIELAYYHGLSQSQMAEHLGIPLGTVKTRVRLGLSKLREAILDPVRNEVHRSKSRSAGV